MSNSKSAKLALLIGINYKKTDAELFGCINDSANLKRFLIRNRYFRKNQIIMMNDNKRGRRNPIKRNIWASLNKLVRFANRNKNKKVQLFISYSGHGSSIKDVSGDELDGFDEVLVPLDYKKSGIIVDDMLKKNFIDKLPKNVELTMLIDACNSGTVLDLKYNYMVDRKGTQKIFTKLTNTKCNVVMVSGCKDNQTSSDAYLPKGGSKNFEYQGAMTASFMKNYKDGISYHNLINGMRQWLNKNSFKQIPQLSAGKPLNLNNQVILSRYN